MSCVPAGGVVRYPTLCRGNCFDIRWGVVAAGHQMMGAQIKINRHTMKNVEIPKVDFSYHSL